MNYTVEDKKYFELVRKQFGKLSNASDESVEEFLERASIIEYCGFTKIERKTQNTRFFANRTAIKLFEEKKNETI